MTRAGLLVLILASECLAQTVGGLTALATPVAGPNILSNPGFESWTGGTPDNWSVHMTGVTQDTVVFHGGASSMKVTNPVASDYVYNATSSQPAGVYTMTAWAKYTSFGSVGTGARLCVRSPDVYPSSLLIACTDPYYGTSDWVQITLTNMVLSQAAALNVVVQIYSGTPTGEFWIDDVVLYKNLYPVQPFLLYPNFKGFLFSDWSQTVSFNVTVDPPDGNIAHYETKYVVYDETTSTQLSSVAAASVADSTITLSGAGWTQHHSITVTFELDLASDHSSVYTHPAYRIITKSLTDRAAMVVVVDPNNRVLINGTPTFLMGAYTSGMSVHATAAEYIPEYTKKFRFSELSTVGGNMNNPYTIGNSVNGYILPMYQYLQGLSTPVWSTYSMACSGSISTTADEPWWFTTEWPKTDHGEIPARMVEPGFLGFYLADECTSAVVGDSFTWAQAASSVSPDRLNTGVLGWPSDVPIWRDVLDLYGIDPYYIDGPSSYPLGNTWRDIYQANANLKSARPILGTMQAYQRPSSRWPTQADLRSVSYMAIAAGANALTYWSLGAGSSSGTSIGDYCDGSSETKAFPQPVHKVGDAVSDTLWWGGYSPGAWTINSGSVPGLTINGDGNGSITGTPTTPGTYYVNAIIAGAPAARDYEFVIVADWTYDYPYSSYSWCDGRITQYGYLKNVVAEISGLSGPLTQADDVTSLTGNTLTAAIDGSNVPSGVATRVKSYSGSKYMIATEVGGSMVNPVFTWHTPIASISVYGESRTITPTGSTFTDSFAGYAAHVYQITEGTSARTVFSGNPRLIGGVRVQ